jgi:hypothetical protein
MPSFYKRPTTEYSDPVNGQRWKAEDTAAVTGHFQTQNAKVNEQIKDAVSRGVPTGIKSEPAQMIAPPPGRDPLAGKTCIGPGLKRNGFGVPKVCGRQAVAVLRTAHFEGPDGRRIDDYLDNVKMALSMSAYGGVSDGQRPIVATGQRVGSLVPDPDLIGDSERFVCHFHSMSAHREHLHPEDNGGIVPDVTPEAPKPLMGLDKLNRVRQWRTVNSDPNFCSITDGITTVLVHTRDWVRFLAENGGLPGPGQPL